MYMSYMNYLNLFKEFICCMDLYNKHNHDKYIV